MDENLIGYLLKALDADEQREVERYLATHPEAEKRLEELQRGFDQLARDAGDDDPPPQLWVRALARVAEHKCRTLPAVPPAVAAHTATGGGWSGWWRRADVLVAAVLLIVLGSLGAMWLVRFRVDHQVVACQNNLLQFYQAMIVYADRNNDEFPRVEAQPPKNFAGSFVPALNEAHTMPPGLSVNCASDRPPSAVTFADLEKMYQEKPDEFASTVRGLAGCYAYSLGYRDANGSRVFGLTRTMDGGLPLMADAPPSQSGNDVLPGNSVNHQGKGQNVLFIDGHVEFRTSRDVRDPYLNAAGRVAAGTSPFDAPVARSDAAPLPE